MQGRDVESGIFYRQLVHIALPHLASAEIERIEARPGKGKHFTRKIDTDALRNSRAEQFQNTPRPGADVDHPLIATVRQDLQQHRLDLDVIDIHCSDFIPFAGVFPKIGICRILPGTADIRQPLHVPTQLRVVLRDKADDMLRQCAGPRPGPVGQTVEHPGAFLKPVQESRIAEQFQMPGNPRLALRQDMRELADGKFALHAY